MADGKLPKRRSNGTVLPGNALNPSGRPRIVQEIQELARSAAPAAFARIVALVNSDDERIAFAASQEILNRAYGKPVMQVNSDVRRVDLSSVWAATMQAINERQRQPAAAALAAPSEILDVQAGTPSEIVDAQATEELEPAQRVQDW
jgi:hypothetical protein